MNPVRRSALALAACGALVVGATAAAEARKPIVSYLDEANAFRLYDLETAQELTPPPVPAGFAQFRWGMSLDGRYVVFTDEQKKLHLLDRATNTELPLAGIDVEANPGSLSVSNTGLMAFDANGNGPARVYDSATQTFVDTGLAEDNGHRQTKLSGDGRFLATTCLSSCEVDYDGGANTYVQDLTTKQDTGFPVVEGFDEEHTCIDTDGSLVGVDYANPAATDPRDVFLYEGGAALDPAGWNDPDKDDTFCILDAAGDYVGLLHDNTEFRIYERATSSFLTLPPDKEFDTRSTFSSPYPPPGTGGGGGPDGDAGPGPDKLAPAILAFGMTRKVFAVGDDPTPRVARVRRGTTFRYRLSEPAGVRIAIQRRAPGRRSKGRCRKPSRKLRGRPRCRRWARVGALRRTGLQAGQVTTPFSGRIGRRALRRGRHRAVLRATDAAGNRSLPRRVRFRIVRPRR